MMKVKTDLCQVLSLQRDINYFLNKITIYLFFQAGEKIVAAIDAKHFLENKSVCIFIVLLVYN